MFIYYSWRSNTKIINSKNCDYRQKNSTHLRLKKLCSTLYYVLFKYLFFKLRIFSQFVLNSSNSRIPDNYIKLYITLHNYILNLFAYIVLKKSYIYTKRHIFSIVEILTSKYLTNIFLMSQRNLIYFPLNW